MNRTTTIPEGLAINSGPSVETRSSVRKTLERAKDVFKSLDAIRGHDTTEEDDDAL